ncbi:MAG: DUF805 domain-containing protein [Tannerella sp.]|jgi:uncharacterized membrane protein YhaH (DUF805 family)|nr:DUF805 domain-containing protein [Tannerella sp.]
MEWYLKVLRQYADFEGRARRTEYWMFVLFNIIFSFVTAIVAVAIMVVADRASAILLSYLYMFAVMLPSMAVAVRRLHDTGRSAWFLLVGLIPLAGPVWLFILLIREGTPGRNRYGDNPKETGYRADFNGNKSVAVTLVVSSFVWILNLLLLCIISGRHVLGIPDFLVPAGLAAVGFLLLQERKYTRNVAYALIITSIVWFIILFRPLEAGYPGIFTIIRMLTLVIPAALLTLGLSVLEKKNGGTAVAILLIAGFCVRFAQFVLDIIIFQGNFSSATDYMHLADSAMMIVPSAGFLVLAMSLLPKKEATNAPVKSGNAGYAPAPQTAANNGGKVYYERDNRGMRVDTLSQSVIYWTVERVRSPRKDPFVYYVFKNEYDARAALLELPFIHTAADTGKLISDGLLRYGYFAVTDNGRFTGEYDAFVSGADFTHDLWRQTHIAFARHNGLKKNDMEPERDAAATARSQPVAVAGNAKNVTFVREDREANSVWAVYKGPSKADAMAFLSRQQIVRPLYYVVVETPEGNFGRDKDGFYQECARTGDTINIALTSY